MTDKELLELAARSAGYEFVWMIRGANNPNGVPNVPFVNGREWNPLVDDGDALRLAVRLSLAFDPCSECANVTIRGSHHAVLCEKNFVDGEDRMPHVRRAIVEAAASQAELWKGLKL